MKKLNIDKDKELNDLKIRMSMKDSQIKHLVLLNQIKGIKPTDMDDTTDEKDFEVPAKNKVLIRESDERDHGAW